MKFSDFTLSTPEENLACDEALLEACENGTGVEVLRFWEPDRYFVVLGYSSNLESDVHVEACITNYIPILRRSSGGGTVLQGPGCLNFSLVLKIDHSGPTRDISSTGCYVLNLHKEALEPLLGREVSINGYTDLSLGQMKFSGNAQRRGRAFALFHGSFLLDADFELMSLLLKVPERQPAYRINRPHEEFLIKLGIEADPLKEALKRVWGADEQLAQLPMERIRLLAREKTS